MPLSGSGEMISGNTPFSDRDAPMPGDSGVGCLEKEGLVQYNCDEIDD